MVCTTSYWLLCQQVVCICSTATLLESTYMEDDQSYAVKAPSMLMVHHEVQHNSDICPIDFMREDLILYGVTMSHEYGLRSIKFWRHTSLSSI